MTIAVSGQVHVVTGFSYAAPVVESVSGCQNVSASSVHLPGGTLDCPREPSGEVLTITGRHFGYEGVKLLLGGKECILEALCECSVM